jgi:hypothetical protein
MDKLDENFSSLKERAIKKLERDMGSLVSTLKTMVNIKFTGIS